VSVGAVAVEHPGAALPGCEAEPVLDHVLAEVDDFLGADCVVMGVGFADEACAAGQQRQRAVGEEHDLGRHLVVTSDDACDVGVGHHQAVDPHAGDEGRARLFGLVAQPAVE